MADYQSIEAGTSLPRGFSLIKRADGYPITTGTVNLYIKALTGTNAGKWWRDSDQTWQAAETANAATHQADGHWTRTLAASPWGSGDAYLEYAKESGDLHVPVSRFLKAAYSPGADSSGRVTVISNADKTGYSISGTKQTLDALNDLSAATVRTQADNALIALNLDHLLAAAVDTDFATTVHINSALGHLADNGSGASFDRTTDSLEAIRDRGDAAWLTGSGTSTLTAADVWTYVTRSLTDKAGFTISGTKTTLDALNDITAAAVVTAMDAGSADLNTIITTLGTIAGYIDTEVAAIKARTDLIPAGGFPANFSLLVISGAGLVGATPDGRLQFTADNLVKAFAFPGGA